MHPLDFSVFRPRGAAAFLVAALGLLAGCASAPSLKDDPKYWETEARKAATARWADISAGDYARAFRFFTTGSQAGYTPDMLRGYLTGIRATGAQIETVTCSDAVCEVRALVTMSIQVPRVGFRQQVLPMVERWIPENGNIRLIRK